MAYKKWSLRRYFYRQNIHYRSVIRDNISFLFYFKFIKNESCKLILQRFWDKVEITSTCWDWKARINNSGYGEFRYKDKIMKAHRFAYQMIKGEIPSNLESDHLCRNKSCVNPHHIELVTKKENISRKTGYMYIKRGHCKQGHKFNKDNTYIRADGYRNCRVCDKLRARTYRKNKEAES